MFFRLKICFPFPMVDSAFSVRFPRSRKIIVPKYVANPFSLSVFNRVQEATRFSCYNKHLFIWQSLNPLDFKHASPYPHLECFQSLTIVLQNVTIYNNERSTNQRNNFILLPCDTTVENLMEWFYNLLLKYVIDSFEFNSEKDMNFW